MYSGDKVFYAVKVSPNDCLGFLIKFCVNENIELEKGFVQQYLGSNVQEKCWMLDDLMNKITSKGNFQHITVLYASCCHYDEYNDMIYIGVELGQNDVAYRNEVKVFDGLSEYVSYYTKNIEHMKQKLEDFKDVYNQEIQHLIGMCTPKIYTMTNDCSNCS